MSRDNLVHRLAEAGLRNDKEALHRTMKALASEARAEQRRGFADRLDALEAGTPEVSDRPKGRRASLLPDDLKEFIHESKARRRISDLVLDRPLETAMREFVEEFSHAALLRSHSLEPKHTLLLVGPPGNGKTSLAEALAYELGLTFLRVRYDGLIGSYMGETAGRLRRVMEFASRTPCLLFFDEFDALGKKRGDYNDMGEIKRVVSSLILLMDETPSHTVVVCASNHPQLLDQALWRRFEVKLQVGLPGSRELGKLYTRLQASVRDDLGIARDEFVRILTGESYSTVEAIGLDVRRRMVIGMGATTAAEAVQSVLDRRSHNSDARLLGDTENEPAASHPVKPPAGGRRQNTRRKAGQAPT
ncbi:AAA family ATPase [Aureimonas pseudogalii]|uniref:AAA+ ATPase domain-containing protein n=1 Tax=Aureimonas pseudogalii TaxID=1744844 RepID=A0A7W6EGF1_9HYPH|nr:AAA family ATPase [Aureimonas pseudogalii]MBB3997484.1 hypothetical protein [Aureimonas pseudogalii]